MAEKLKFSNVNKIPAPTWSWLKMNRDSAEIQEPCLKEPEIAEIPRGYSVLGGEDISLGLFPALSAGIGDELSDYLEKNVFRGVDRIIQIDRTDENSKPLLLSFKYGGSEDSAALASSQIIYARKNSEGTVIFLYEGAENAETDSVVRTKVYAEENARVHIIKVQLLGGKQNQIDETSCSALENAEIRLTQIELGGKHINAGMRTELSSFRARFRSELAFIAKNEQHFDINHTVIHTGRETDTKMSVRGAVDGNAVKVYRGTIDFKHGCAGATGDEQEETLLLSGAAVSKSIPVILCDEENVSGSHGATLGRLGTDELFYMQSRGVSEEEAKKMMTRAKILSVAGGIPDEAVRAKIESFIG